MSWFRDRLRARREPARAALTGPVPVVDPDDPGFAVYNPPQASSIPVAWACVNVLADALTRCRLFVTRRGHPLAAMLQSPSRVYDPAQLWGQLYSAAIAGGNGYALIMRDASGQPAGLAPCTATPRVASRGLQYTVQLRHMEQATPSPVAARDIVALHGPGYDGLVSPSPVASAAREALGVIASANQHNRQSLNRGMNARAVLTMDPQIASLTPTQREEIMRVVASSYAGARNAGTIPLLPPGVSPAQTGGMSAVDMQLIELMRWSVEDVCRVFSVPPRMVGHTTHGMRVETKLGQQGEDFFRWSLAPWITRIEAQLTAKLLNAADREAGVRVRMSADALSQGTFAERVAAIDQAVAKAGVITINEGRAVLGYAPRADGDRLILPAGTPEKPVAQGNDQ